VGDFSTGALTANLARHEWWQQNINDRLPRLLDELPASDVFGIGNGHTERPNTYGVYLFSSPEPADTDHVFCPTHGADMVEEAFSRRSNLSEAENTSEELKPRWNAESAPT
jgi:hypothetical protein